MGWTKEYRAKYLREYYLANKEEIEKKKKEWLDNNREKNRAYQRAYMKLQKRKQAYLRINQIRYGEN